jgi:hypothetical protein
MNATAAGEAAIVGNKGNKGRFPALTGCAGPGEFGSPCVGQRAGRTFGFPGVTGHKMGGGGAGSKGLAARWHREVGMSAHYDRGTGGTGQRCGRSARKMRRSNIEHSTFNVQGTKDERQGNGEQTSADSAD